VPSLASPAKLDAVSFADLALMPSLPGPEYVYSEYALRSKIPQYMIRSHRYKYIHSHGAKHELYDLWDDPGEYKNLNQQASHKKIATELRNQLYNWFNPELNPFN